MASSQLPRASLSRSGLQRLVVASVGAAGAQTADSRAALPDSFHEEGAGVGEGEAFSSLRASSTGYSGLMSGDALKVGPIRALLRRELDLPLIPTGVIDGVTKVIFCRSGLPAEQRHPLEMLVSHAASDPEVQRAYYRVFSKTTTTTTIQQHHHEVGEEACQPVHRHDSKAIEDDDKDLNDFAEVLSSASSDISAASNDDKVMRVVEKLHYAVECAVCLESYKNPVVLNCPGRHVLCRKHISSLPHAEVSLWQQFVNGLYGVIPRQCPACRGVFTSVQKCRPIDDMVEALRAVAKDCLPDLSALGEDTDDKEEGLNGKEGEAGIPVWALPVVGVVLLLCFLIVGGRRR